MAVTDVKLDGAHDHSFTSDKQYEHTYNQAYIIETDDGKMSGIDVETQAISVVAGFTNALPIKWSVYNLAPYDYLTGGQDPYSFCSDFSWSKPDPLDKPDRWRCEVQYTPLGPNEEEGDKDTSPLLRPTKYWQEFETYQDIINHDKDNALMLNSAGQQFTEPPQFDVYRMTLVAQKNFSGLSTIIAYANTFQNAVNSVGYLGMAARQWLIRTVEAGPIQTEQEVSFYTCTFRLILHEANWDIGIADAGFSQLVGGEIKRILDADDKPVVEPWNLNSDGTKVPGDGVPGFLKHFRAYQEVDFNNLPI